MYHTRGKLAVYFLFCLLSLSHADYQWFDCGPPLTKSISYQSMTMYPSTLDVDSEVSLNIQAYIVREIQAGTTTTIQVYRNGQPYLNATTVMDLCSILASNSISCPYNQASISYTYQVAAASMPMIPSGSYSLQISHQYQSEEIACLTISGTVDGLETASSCSYVSTFEADLGGGLDFQISDPVSRLPGNWIQVGPYGPAGYSSDWGTFTDFTGTSQDLLPSSSISATSFVWGLNGTLNSVTNSGQTVVHNYTGNFMVSYNNSGVLMPVYIGVFSLQDTIQLDTNIEQETFTGQFTLSPGFTYFSQLTYPLTLGNLGPLTLSGPNYALNIQAQRSWCTCTVDACGVCGGDGSSCGQFVSTQTSKSNNLPANAIAAIVISCVGAALLLFVVYLLHAIKTKKYARPVNDDMDLLDPQKPDYGTMAINELLDGREEDL